MLDLHLELMFVVLFIFFLLIFVLNGLLYRPLLEFMSDRDNSIANDLKAAKELTGNTDELNAQSQEVLDNAKAEASSIRQKSIDIAKKEAVTNIIGKQKEHDDKYQTFIDELNVAKDELKSTLLAQMPLFKNSLQANLNKL
jgi:F-type H+-transporting ATPase subunit b